MQLELTFGNNQIHLPSVRAFLTATLQQFPLETVTVEKLGTFINAAVEAAISEAYPAGEEGWIKLSIQEQHGRLEIRIRVFGIPKDVKLMERQLQQAGATATSRLGIPAADVADEVHWLTFGPEGKALQVV
jgi:anti-sigma regulatory factor (Ser/Thr protein kinase)